MVFGASPGQEISEGQMNWRPCPAVASLHSLLGRYDVFGGHLGGRSGYYNEFNRHHAGLACDIMLRPSDAGLVRLGQHLFKLFVEKKHIMRWRGMIYQHVALTFSGQPTADIRPNRWRDSDHINHIHIDWHDSRNVTWTQIDSIPFRRRNGTTTTLTPKQGNRIAASIAWTQQAMTDYRQNTELQNALDALIAQHRQGSLTPLDLQREVGLVSN
jgi:hypothetical protein